MEAFKSIAWNLKMEKHSLPSLDVDTRSNSTWEMVNGILLIRKALEELLRRILDHHVVYTDLTIAPGDTLAKWIPEESWSCLLDFAKLLKPFRDVTVLMSASEYPTMGMAIPVFHMCSQHAKTAQATTTGFRSTRTIEIARSVLRKLSEYDGKFRNQFTKISTALDPRTKSFLSALDIDRDQIVSDIVDEYQTYYKSRYERECSVDEILLPSSDSERAPIASAISNLLELLQTPTSSTPLEQFTPERFENEVSRWFEHQGMKIDHSSRDVCMWFKVNQALFPRITFMARDYMVWPICDK